VGEMPSLLNLRAGGTYGYPIRCRYNFGRRDLRLFQGAHNYPVKHIRAIYKVSLILGANGQHLVQRRCAVHWQPVSKVAFVAAYTSFSTWHLEFGHISIARYSWTASLYSEWLQPQKRQGSVSSLSLCPKRPWGPLILLYNRDRGLFLGGKGVKLFTHFHLVPL
jgi:hypothetical protein